MGRRILDEKIMDKLVRALGKPASQVSVRVSQKASKLGISAEAALVILAKENGIGTALYQRKLDPAKQAEVRAALPSMFPASVTSRPSVKKSASTPAGISPRQRLKAAIEYLIQDPELRERCQDVLMGTKHFDRAINSATTVLEDRIRKKALPDRRLVGENLVSFAFNEDLSRTVLQIASADPDDQRGYTQILRGVVPAFRNKTHHHIVGSFSREDALRVCGFIDVLLRAVDSSKKVK